MMVRESFVSSPSGVARGRAPAENGAPKPTKRSKGASWSP